MANKRRKNPSTGAVLVTLAVLTAAGAGAWYWVTTEDEKKAKAKKAKKKKTIADLPRPPIDDKDIPTEPEDEYGLVFNEDCTDFTFTQPPEDSGEQMPQAMAFYDAIQAGIEEAKGSGDFDPFEVAADALNAISPDQCEFPPDPDGSDRIVQLYLYNVALIGVLGLKDGLSVDGVNSVGGLDAKIAQLASDRGYPAFDPTVIPEILPDAPGTPGGEPPEMGEGAFVPTVEKLTPEYIMAGDKVTKIYAEGNLDSNTQIRLFDEEALADIQELDLDYFGPGVFVLNVKSMTPGKYRAFVRQSDEDEWEPAEAVLDVRSYQVGIQLGETQTAAIDEN